jgi:hypothetical protein
MSRPQNGTVMCNPAVCLNAVCSPTLLQRGGFRNRWTINRGK